MDVYGTSAGGEQAGSGQAVVSGWRGCTAPNNLDTGEGLRGGWSGLWASALMEECHRARPGQAQAAVAGACGPAWPALRAAACRVAGRDGGMVSPW